MLSLLSRFGWFWKFLLIKFMSSACGACMRVCACVRLKNGQIGISQICAFVLCQIILRVYENLRDSAYPTKLIETFQCMTVIEWFIHCYTFDTRTRNIRGEGNRERASQPTNNGNVRVLYMHALRSTYVFAYIFFGNVFCLVSEVKAL